MKCSPRQNTPFVTLWTLLVLLLLTAAFAGSTFAARTTPVLCTGLSTDRTAIQAAINNSSPGDTIELVGTCQLDGTAIFINISNLTIEGAGAAGNWGTVVSGLTDSNGVPLGDGSSPSFLRFNRGLSIGPSNTTISGVTIQGIKFTNLNVAVELSPSISGSSLLCSQVQITSGSASDILVANNWFDNDRRAVSNFGLSDHVNVTDNFITNSGLSTEDILSGGGTIGCHNSDGSVSSVSIQFPSDVRYQNNVITSDRAVLPIFAATVQSVKIIKNTITAGTTSLPIVVAAQSAYVSQNVVNGQGFALAGIFDNQALVPFPTLDHQISNNSVTNNSLIGIGVDSGIFGASIVNNQFDASGVVNILLCDANGASPYDVVCDGGGLASHDNTVITTNFASTVLDLGVQNRLIGTQNLLNNANVPASVQANLIKEAAGRPQLP